MYLSMLICVSLLACLWQCVFGTHFSVKLTVCVCVCVHQYLNNCFRKFWYTLYCCHYLNNMTSQHHTSAISHITHTHKHNQNKFMHKNWDTQTSRDWLHRRLSEDQSEYLDTCCKGIIGNKIRIKWTLGSIQTLS